MWGSGDRSFQRACGHSLEKETLPRENARHFGKQHSPKTIRGRGQTIPVTWEVARERFHLELASTEETRMVGRELLYTSQVTK